MMEIFFSLMFGLFIILVIEVFFDSANDFLRDLLTAIVLMVFTLFSLTGICIVFYVLLLGLFGGGL